MTAAELHQAVVACEAGIVTVVALWLVGYLDYRRICQRDRKGPRGAA